MKTLPKKGNPAGLYVLGALYPEVTGGMEIFNYYFLNYQVKESRDTIYYLSEKPLEIAKGEYVQFKKRRPVRLFYPIQFFLAVSKLSKKVHYAYLPYAEQSWILVFAQSLVFRLFKIPYIITIHWGKEPDWRFGYPFKYYFRHARAVIGVSEPICVAFKKTIPKQEFLYIPPLIPFVRSETPKNLLKKQLGYQEQEKILIFVGSLKGMKNPDKIVEAFFKIGAEYLENHQIRLIIAGKGEMEHAIREKIDHYNLGKFIRLEGLVKREKIPDYFKAADAYIISSDYEGTSLSLLEAMYNKLVIIGSNAPGINKMLTHEVNALLYDTHNISDLAETIKRAFSDQILVENLAKRANFDFSNQYSYESMIKRYQAIFSEA
jgi:glycosyltransferase involved in cell wall biosynthesis